MLPYTSTAVSTRFVRVLLAGVSGIALAGAASPAFGQTANAPAQAGSGEQSPAPGIENGDAQASSAIIVTGRRRAIESAIRRKEAADSIIDSVVADEAGKLPDDSITEVLQRVSGVSIVRFSALGDPDRFTVEGSGVQVRGLSGVQTRLNGREIFGANSGRTLSFGDVPPELMKAVDVYKSPTADLIEGGTGGQIDLRTKLPFDFNKPSVVATLEATYGDLRKKTTFNGSLLATHRIDTPIGEMGLLVDLARSNYARSAHFFRMEPYYKTRIGAQDYYIPGGYDFGRDDLDQKRTGLYAAFQWAPSQDLKFTQTFFQSTYDESRFERGSFVTSQSLAVDPAASTFDDSNGLLTSSNVFVRNNNFVTTGAITSGGNTTVADGTTRTRDLSTSFEWTPDGPLALAGSVQFIRSTSVRDSYAVFREHNFGSQFGLDLTGDLPQIQVPAATQASFSDPTQYRWQATMPHNDDNIGKQFAIQLDAEYRFETDGFFKSMKAGFRHAERKERDLGNGFNWSELGRGWGTAGGPQQTFANARPGDVELEDWDNFFRGETVVPGPIFYPTEEMVAPMDRDRDHAVPPVGFNPALGQPTPTGYGGQSYTVLRNGVKFLPRDRSYNNTETYAGYGLVRFGSPEGEGLVWKGNVGARVVHTRNYSDGFFTQNSAQFLRNGVLVRTAQREDVRSGGREYLKLLPAINVQVLPRPDVHVRFAYNITMDNPSLYALRARGSVGYNTTAQTLPPGSPPGTPSPPNLFNFFTADTGNPALKPTMSKNIDLSFEWYPKSGTQFHLALFRKRLDDLIIYTSTSRPVEIFYIPTTTPPGQIATTAPTSSAVESLITTDVENSTETARIRGFEIGGRTFFDMLPGVLSGFGLDANYTYIDSKNPGDRYIDINGVAGSDLPVVGLSKHNFNVTLMYEKSWFSARLAYSWRDKFLMSTNTNGTNGSYNYRSAPTTTNPNCTVANAFCQFIDYNLPIYSDKFGSLDAGMTVRFTKNIRLSLESKNILNTTQRTLMGGYNDGKKYVRSWFQSDRRVNARLTLGF